MMKFLTLSVLATAGLLGTMSAGVLVPTNAHGDTAVTSPTALANRNDEGIPFVRAKCSLTVNKDKTLSVECEFDSRDPSQERKFLFCIMIDLKEGKKGGVPGIESKTFSVVRRQEGGVDKLKCVDFPTVPVAPPPNSPSSWHFGCQVVTVGPGQKVTKRFTSAGAYTPPEGVAPSARDFEVAYADIIDLMNTDLVFDAESCERTNRQRGFVSPTPMRREGNFVFATWVMQKQPFEDPHVRYQSMDAPVADPCSVGSGDSTAFCGTSPPAQGSRSGLFFKDDLPENRVFRWASSDAILGEIDTGFVAATRWSLFGANPPRLVFVGGGDGATFFGNVLLGRYGRAVVDVVRGARRVRYLLKAVKQYVPFDETPCVPSGFEASVPELPICPLGTGPVPPVHADLNLFWYESMEAPPGTVFPAVLDLALAGDTTGVDIVTVPEPLTEFDIPAAQEPIGRLSACSSHDVLTCAVPDVEEGRQVEVVVNVDSAVTGEPLFFQTGQFIQDTSPPNVVSHSTTFDVDNRLVVDVVATDETTSPIHADFWFSTDDGLIWDFVPLSAATSVLEEPSTQAFHGVVGPFASGAAIRYFLSVQDAVFNVTYFGVGKIPP